MADEKKSARDNSEGNAPLMPGGEPEQSGTGPQGALFTEDSSAGDASVYDAPSGATTTDGVPAPGVNKSAKDEG